jgi:hypothetical protein
MTVVSLDMAYRSFREVLAGSTPASIRRLQSNVAGLKHRAQAMLARFLHSEFSPMLRSGVRTPLRGGLDFPMSPPSTIRRGFRRLGRKYFAARDLQHEPQIAWQYEPCDHGYHREPQGKEQSKVEEPKRLQHR